MIRKATIADIPAIVPMGKAFFDYASFDRRGLTQDQNAFGEFLAMLLSMPAGVVLVAEKECEIVGTIAGALAPWILNHGQRMLTELWWWVMPQHHGDGIGTELIKAFEQQGRDMGASHVIMVTLAGDMEQKLESVYVRMGYSHLERHFVKEV